MKITAIIIRPSGTPKTPHSLLLIFNLLAEMMFGMLPGMSMPPEIRRPRRTHWILAADIFGESSAAVSVALSRIAETIFIQKRAKAGTLTRYRSTIGINPVPRRTSAKTKI